MTTRNSIHVTMTAQLRAAQVRQRLEALAGNTGLPVAQIAGRALAVGLGHIEGNPLLIFPAAPTLEQPTAPAAEVIAAPKPCAVRPGRVTSKEAAQALGKSLAAFTSQLHRNPKLKRHSKRKGKASMWDLAGLRADWTK